MASEKVTAAFSDQLIACGSGSPVDDVIDGSCDLPCVNLQHDAVGGCPVQSLVAWGSVASGLAPRRGGWCSSRSSEAGAPTGETPRNWPRCRRPANIDVVGSREDREAAARRAGMPRRDYAALGGLDRAGAVRRFLASCFQQTERSTE